MPIRVAVIVVVLLVVAGGLLVRARQATMEKPDVPVTPTDIPTPPKEGPLGKAKVLGSTVHDFGTMEHGSKGEHVFKIRNDGDGPLELVARAGDSSCQCTVGSLGANGLKSGEETEVRLKWEIKNPSQVFQHFAKIRTNDPKRPEITFRVRGLVGNRLVIKPGIEIPIGVLSEGKPTERSFKVLSQILDSFEIKSLECSSELMKIEQRSISPDEVIALNREEHATLELAERDRQAMAKSTEKEKTDAEEKHDHDHDHDEGEVPVMAMMSKAPKAKCGYEVKVSFLPGFPVGKLRESVTLVTSIDDKPRTISFEGTRAGSMQILATPGVVWSPAEGLLRLGRFQAAEGKKVRLLVFVNKGEKEMEASNVKVDPPQMKFELVKDPTFKGMGRERFDMNIEVPAGLAPISLGSMNHGFITFDTNNPDVGSVKMELEFTSF